VLLPRLLLWSIPLLVVGVVWLLLFLFILRMWMCLRSPRSRRLSAEEVLAPCIYTCSAIESVVVPMMAVPSHHRKCRTSLYRLQNRGLVDDWDRSITVTRACGPEVLCLAFYPVSRLEEFTSAMNLPRVFPFAIDGNGKGLLELNEVSLFVDRLCDEYPWRSQ
jgi:Na+-transporting methylmalonyl-CoA/oxaloacetate decarboxylase gamma subunit